MITQPSQAGYIIELAPGGPWLTQNLSWTPLWAERGIWESYEEANLAVWESLCQEEAAKPTETPDS